MFIRIEAASATPIYRQVIDQIRYQAASGLLRPGEQLPSVRALAAEVGVNQNTILKVYNELCREGLFRVERGSGTFVAEKAPGEALSEQRKLQAVRPALAQAAAWAVQLGIEPRRLHELLDEQFAQLAGAGGTAAMAGAGRAGGDNGAAGAGGAGRAGGDEGSAGEDAGDGDGNDGIKHGSTEDA